MSAGQVEPEGAAAMWGGTCDTCDFILVIDGDGKPVPPPVEWDQFQQCPVCGGSVSFDSYNETQWNRENRLMKGVLEQHLTRVRTILLTSRYKDIPAETFKEIYELLGGKPEELE